MELFLRLLLSLYDAIAGVVFVAMFTKAERIFSLKSLTVALIVFLSSPISDIPLRLYIEDPSLIHSVVTIGALMFLSFSAGKAEPAVKLASPFIFEAVSLLINSMSLMYFFSNFLSVVSATLFVSLSTTFITALVAKVIMSSILFFIAKSVSYEGRHKRLTLITYSLSPIFTLFLLYMFMKIMYYRLSEYTIQVYVAVIGTALLNIMSFYMFDRTLKAEDENSKLQLYKSKSEMERIQYSELLRLNDELREVRHDLKNHIICVKKYIDEGDSASLEKYMNDFKESVNSSDVPIVTGNSMLDYIISSKVMRQDVTLVATGVLGDIGNIDELDLAVLVGNLIDNAIDAVNSIDKKEKLIELDFSIFNGYKNIIIKNDISTSVLADNKALQTTKKDKKAHGFGMRSIRGVVDKYDGILEYYEEDNKFCVHVAFPTA